MTTTTRPHTVWEAQYQRVFLAATGEYLPQVVHMLEGDEQYWCWVPLRDMQGNVIRCATLEQAMTHMF